MGLKLMTIVAGKRIPTGEWLSHGVDETFKLGEQVGSQLAGGEVLLLRGALGAGKTIFVKGIAAGLGIDPKDVTSPSFTLVNPHEGRRLLYHIDLYRLKQGASAAYAVDLDELLMDEEAIMVIEWPERLGPYPLPAKVWRITITGEGEDSRKILIA